MIDKERFENILKSFRVRQGKEWTQERTAQQLGVSRRTYVGWENGESFPSKRTLTKLADLLQLDEVETEALFLSAYQTTPVRHNLPFARNPFFTGRQPLIEEVERLFKENGRIALTQSVSISGLGGIGKTQLALEYAHRCYPHTYHSVLWVNASDKATLQASYLGLARLLQLPDQQERDVDRVIYAVNNWLEEHTHWLLILDNADDLELACSFLPTAAQGHVLFTTRSQIVGNLAALVQVETMPAEEGLLFLLRRCGFLKAGTSLESLSADVRREAAALVALLGGHPLALDQAGAYIEEAREPGAEVSGAFFAEYCQLYQQERRQLLQKRGWFQREHPEAVATTLEMSLHKAYALHPRCAEILAFCALLHPDAIPEELLREKSGLNLDLLEFNDAMRALRRYSLIKRDNEKQVLSLHRLVQAVIKDSMNTQELGRWTERVMQAVNAAFPEVTFEVWPRCERYLPHALVCVNLIEQDTVAPTIVAQLLVKAAAYLRRRGQYIPAEPLLVQAVAIREKVLGSEHPDTIQSLNHLALLAYSQGKYEQAEPVLQRVLLSCEQHRGVEHPDTAKCLNSLANLYLQQGKYEQAEPLYVRALLIREQHLGVEDPGTAQNMNDLAALYVLQGKYEQAEPLLQRALALREQHLGAEHPDTPMSLNNLAALYQRQGKCSQAEPLLQRALSIREQHLGAEHPDTAAGMNNLAVIYWQQGKYEQAEPLYVRALSIREQHLGAEHPDTLYSLHSLAELYQYQNKYEQAEPLYVRALAIREQRLGATHPDTAQSLHSLAELYQWQGKYEQAEQLYVRALSIREQRLGAMHPDIARTLYGLAQLYQSQGKYDLAETSYQRALHIQEQCLGANHPETEKTLYGYTAFLHRCERGELATVLGTGDKPSAEEC